MSDLDDFLTPTLTRQVEAEQALINGDPEPRLAMWSTQDPVTVFGADAGASGDLAYTLGYEHITVSIDGGRVAPLTLRVTHLYRREDGEWKTIHRHADAPQPGRSVPPTHRRSRRSSSGSGPRWGHIPPERQGQQRSRAVGRRFQLSSSSVSITGPGTTPVLSRTEEDDQRRESADQAGPS